MADFKNNYDDIRDSLRYDEGEIFEMVRDAINEVLGKHFIIIQSIFKTNYCSFTV